MYRDSKQVLGNIPPEGFKRVTFNIMVKNWSQLSKLDAEILINETSFNEQAKRKIELPFDVRIPQQPVIVDRTCYVAVEEAVLFTGASKTASEFCRAPKGASLHAIGELPGWVQVEMRFEENSKKRLERLWVESNSLSTVAPIQVAETSIPPIIITRFGNRPPLISFIEPNKNIETTDESIRFMASVVDVDSKIKDVIVQFGDTESSLRGLMLKPVVQSRGESSEDTRVIEHVINLKKGKNIILISATDENGAKSSRSIEIVRKRKIGKTYMVAIGINEYPQPYELSCARHDAENLANFAKKHLGVDNSNLYTFLDNNATRLNIMSIFGELRKNLKPEDTLIVFLAGHGMIDRIADREEKYFLPVDINYQNLFATAIEMNRFHRMLDVRAERVLVIADLCYSGDIKLRGGTEQFFEPLFGKGRILIGYEGVAREDKTLGSGYLTYYLLEGLKGLADKDQNGKITFHEAYEYASTKIREITGSGLWIKGEGNIELITNLRHFSPE
ncbi:MAG: caspase family protein [Candidatus Aenigmarchaeota archaeon]|nr:caspase family protein [Candidatus Aenigmarchaeota archaeon]